MNHLLDTKEYEGKDGSHILLRPAEKKDAKAIIQAANDIVSAGKYIQKERVKTEAEEHAFIDEVIVLHIKSPACN